MSERKWPKVGSKWRHVDGGFPYTVTQIGVRGMGDDGKWKDGLIYESELGRLWRSLDNFLARFTPEEAPTT